MLAEKSDIIFEGENSTVYHQENSEWGVPVVIKTIKNDQASAEQIQAFYNEYSITQKLEIAGVRKVYSKTKFEGKAALVMEYIPGSTLEDIIKAQPIQSFERLLKISIQICHILGEIHQSNVIHKDLDCKNILISENEQVFIIDFGISARISLKANQRNNHDKLEGTLAYISPEQTGRMNRRIDTRSDLYSLGVVLYELFTGRLPFQSEDPMEMVHNHLAQSPAPPQSINPKMPEVISDIILMLMRKNAEDRYQSAFGLRYDLEKCLQEWQEEGRITSFEIATHDFSGRFQIPDKLYGRQKEVGYLLDAFERTSQGIASLMLVAGYSGVGKSALVHEIHQPIQQRQGYFIEGKFDQFQRNVPYFAFIQAFKSFVNYLLTENSRELERWKQKILKAVGNNGKILTDVIPALELIIGKQPDSPELGATEAQNRFNLVFQNFVTAISRREHPLVIFIDDWQWADAASMNLLKLLLTNRAGDHLLIIGAYRKNEVGEGHPFLLSVEEIREESIQIHELELSNLHQEHIQQLISDVLKAETEQISDLVELIYQKTQGNAFFVQQMLLSLYEEGLLHFNFELRHWQWDIQKIQALNITDNVVSLMAGKVQKLPEVTQDLLKLASCVGNRFHLDTLAIIDEMGSPDDTDSTHRSLEPALIEGLVIPLENDFKFAHDRIQQAVYSLIPDEERKVIHLRIGRLLLDNIPDNKREENLFDIVNQLNFGRDLLETSEEKYFLTCINLEAGKKANLSAAYKPAFDYLKIALELLPKDAWINNYDLTLEIYAAILQVAFLKGDLELSSQYIHIIREKAAHVLDKMPAFEIEMQYHIAKGNLQEAIEVGLEVLDLLNITLADAPQKDIDVSIIEQLPHMKNPEIKAGMEIMDSIISPASATNPELFRKITYTMVNLSLEYGNSASACVGYAFYGGLLCGALGNIDLGYQLGKLAVNMLDKFNAKFFKAKVDNLYVSTVMHWKEPARATRKPHFEAIQVGLETGEIEFASYNIVESCHYHFLMGISLESLGQKYAQNLELIKQLKQGFHVQYLTPWQQMIENLSNPQDEPTKLQGAFFEEDTMLPEYINEQQLTLAFITLQAKTMLSYYFGDYAQALRNAEMTDQYKEGVTGMLFMPVHNFFYSLALLAQFPEASTEEKIKYLAQINENQKTLANWAKYSPDNCSHKHHLIQAETMRLSGQTLRAMEYYDKAIEEAREHMYIQEEALANELAGKFYLGLAKEKIAKVYLQDAYYRYQLWGANNKLNNLEKHFGKYLQRGQSSKPRHSNTQSTSVASPSLDMHSIIKASQALSGEVILSSLLQKMMRIVIENAGAEKGLFILEREGRWVLEADCHLNQTEEESLLSIPIEDVNGMTDTPKLSSDLVYYVIRTRQSVVINNASQERGMIGANYVAKVSPKSVLCMPLIHQGKLTGILYLENNLTSEAFTPDRLEILEILSAQITISLENALLYENLEEKVKERTEEVVKAKEIIEKKNQDITSSINYAKRIQEATLPQIEEIKKILPESFVLFKPRDIVSGDFYWYARLEPRPIYEDQDGDKQKVLVGYESEKVVITAVDCTGHGVPGAFMSMIGNDLLNEIVDLRGITQPDVILNELHEGVVQALRQNDTDNKDGMDLSLCVIDKENKIVEFAGAKNPLIYIKDGKLHQIKGDKLPIGGVRIAEERQFQKHQIKVDSPTTFYIFTDGYQDQFGGVHARKFMIRQLRDLLLEIHQKPLEEQHQILKDTFQQWTEGHRQIDDVLMIGFRIE